MNDPTIQEIKLDPDQIEIHDMPDENIVESKH